MCFLFVPYVIKIKLFSLLTLSDFGMSCNTIPTYITKLSYSWSYLKVYVFLYTLPRVRLILLVLIISWKLVLYSGRLTAPRYGSSFWCYPLSLHLSEQYFTLLHNFSHFLRQLNGLPQASHILLGRCCFFTPFGMYYHLWRRRLSQDRAWKNIA